MDIKTARIRLAAVPNKPGVYILKDATGTVLYVGKATSLRGRLRSYFTGRVDSPAKITKMMPRVSDFEYVITDSEAEALLLENNFIKHHKPRFNIRLKDDKNYPYIKIDLLQEWPRLDITRRAHADGARYFGPFASAASMRKTLALLKRLFPYRSCTKAITGNDPRPCLEYYIHRCVAPCVGFVTRDEYRSVIDQVILFLEGSHDRVLRELREAMGTAAKELNFERAAVIRDQIQAIKRVAQEQKVVSKGSLDQDIIALAKGEDEACVETFFVRNGKLTGRDSFIMQGAQEEAPTTIIEEFIKQFYLSASFVPAEILVQHMPENTAVVVALLEERRGRRVRLRMPMRGESRRLVSLVERNAQEGLVHRQAKWLADHDKASRALADLQEHLSLESTPHRIETYDISNTQGTNAVGSMVVFERGLSKRSAYRRFKIKSVDGPDDYAMLQELLRRRFREASKSLPHVRASGASPHSVVDLPSLVIVDGGKGQLNAALEVLLELGLADLPLVSLAKAEERVFMPEMPDPVLLPRTSDGLYLLQRMRDEAHRFAITYHRKVRSKRTMGSVMDEIRGIGPKRKRALLRKFGSVQALRDASPESIAAVPGMTRSLAETVKALL